MGNEAITLDVQNVHLFHKSVNKRVFASKLSLMSRSAALDAVQAGSQYGVHEGHFFSWLLSAPVQPRFWRSFNWLSGVFYYRVFIN